MEIPRCIVENVQKQGFPSRLDELEEVSRRAIDFYEREENHAKVSEIKNFRDYLVEMEEENF